MPMPKAPSPLGALLQELFRKKKWQQRLDQHALFMQWEEIVGPEIAGRAQPDCIRGDVLWLRVVDSVWMQQLSLQKGTLLELLRGRLGERGITDIRFRLDIGLGGPTRPAAGERAPRQRPVSTEELREFEEMALPLKDDELKAALRRLWLKSRGHRT